VIAERRGRSCAWLTGEIDHEVTLPVHLVCAALDLDPAVLAAAVRTRIAA